MRKYNVPVSVGISAHALLPGQALGGRHPHPGEDDPDEARDHGALAGQVVVDRHRAHPEVCGQPAHRQGVQAFPVHKLERRREDTLARQWLLPALGRPALRPCSFSLSQPILETSLINHTQYV